MAALIAGGTFFPPPPAGQAAAPSSGSIPVPSDPSPSEQPKQTIQYTGGPIPAGDMGGITGASAEDQARACEPSNCDSFKLTVDIPESFWMDRFGQVVVEISWAQTEADADLYVFDADGSEVDSSGNTTGFTSERVDLPQLSQGVYYVNVHNYNPVELSSYEAKIELFIDGVAAPALDTKNSTGIRFGPATQVSPMSIGAEPGINFDLRPDTGGKVIFIDWPTGDPLAQKGSLYRSDDNGASFRRLESVLCGSQGWHTPSCAQSGGGDTEVILSPTTDYVYFSDQEVLVQEGVAVSPDGGRNWPPELQHAVTNGTSVVDRQWMAARKGTEELAYLSYHVPALGEYIHRITGGGLVVTPQPAPQVPGVVQSGPMLVDNSGGPHDGRIYFIYVGVGASPDLPIQLRIGTHDGNPATFSAPWTTYPIAPVDHLVGGINWLQMDTAGNLYAAYAEERTADTYMVTMKADAPENLTAPGSRWSTPVRVSNAPANTTVFPSIAAGSPGRVALSYFATDAPGSPDFVRPTAAWNVYAALSTNALCQWEASPCESPSFEQALVNHRVIHKGGVCTFGAGCSGPDDRSLLDFLDLGYDQEGRLGITWTDDNTDLDRNELVDPGLADFNGLVHYAAMTSGPSMLVGKPAISVPEPQVAIDPPGDATWPVSGPLAVGPNYPSLDILGTSINRVGEDLVVKMQISDLANLDSGLDGTGRLGIDGTPGDAVKAQYLVNWYYGDHMYFAAAEFIHESDSDPRTIFYSGRLDANDPDGADQTADSNGLAVFYHKDKDANGVIVGNEIRITVPVKDVGSPALGDTLHSVTGSSFTGHVVEANTSGSVPNLIDAAPPFDLVIAAPGAAPIPKLPSTGWDSAITLLGAALLLAAAFRLGAWIKT